MADSLNIKDAEARRLAQAVADATGESLTRAVTEALRERYARLVQHQRKATVAEILEIADRVAPSVHRPIIDHDALLYDDDGLPR